MGWEAKAMEEHKPDMRSPNCVKCGATWPCPTLKNWWGRRRK